MRVVQTGKLGKPQPVVGVIGVIALVTCPSVVLLVVVMMIVIMFTKSIAREIYDRANASSGAMS
jgi:hypothetical protein